MLNRGGQCYMAPEYASSGKLTDKLDVFSYGIMLLELITGHRPVNTTHSYMEDSLVDWIVHALEGDASLSDLNEGIIPGHSTQFNSHGSSDYDTSQYNEDMKKFRKMALGSQEYGYQKKLN